MIARNFVKEAAASGQSIRGIHLTFAAPSVIEVLAAADLQFVYVDGEHGCFDWRDIEAARRAGVRAIHLAWDYVERSATDPDVTVGSLSEAVSWIRRAGLAGASEENRWGRG